MIDYKGNNDYIYWVFAWLTSFLKFLLYFVYKLDNNSNFVTGKCTLTNILYNINQKIYYYYLREHSLILKLIILKQSWFTTNVKS